MAAPFYTQWTCPSCYRMFSESQDLRNHLEIDKVRVRRLLEELREAISTTCCPSQGTGQLALQQGQHDDALNNSYLDCTQSDNHDLRCPHPDCKDKERKLYSKKANLLRHYHIHVKCDAKCACGKSFTDLSNFTKHFLTCTTTKNIKRQASGMDQKQSQAFALKNHLSERAYKQLNQQLGVGRGGHQLVSGGELLDSNNEDEAMQTEQGDVRQERSSRRGGGGDFAGEQSTDDASSLSVSFQRSRKRKRKRRYATTGCSSTPKADESKREPSAVLAALPETGSTSEITLSEIRREPVNETPANPHEAVSGSQTPLEQHDAVPPSLEPGSTQEKGLNCATLEQHIPASFFRPDSWPSLTSEEDSMNAGQQRSATHPGFFFRPEVWPQMRSMNETIDTQQLVTEAHPGFFFRPHVWPEMVSAYETTDMSQELMEAYPACLFNPDVWPNQQMRTSN